MKFSFTSVIRPGVVMAFLLLYTIQVCAQDDTASVSEKFSPPEYLLSYWDEMKDLATAPAGWDSREWATCGMTVASTLYLMTLDKDLQSFFSGHRNPASDNISRYALEPWGNYYSLGTLGIFYLQGWLGENAYSRETALLGLKSFVLGGLAARIPKLLSGRHRPYQDLPADPWYWEGPGLEYHSFVSGHTTAVFAVASTLASRYPDKKWVGMVSYSIAGMAALSRLYDNQHWASDVLAGAVLGYAIGTRVGRKRDGNEKLGFFTGPNGTGLIFTF